jgi:hypothetical protein
VFAGNDGGNGGAVWIEGQSNALVVGCEIHLNTVGGIGGGIGIGAEATPTIRDCYIHDNTASTGGGICTSAVGGVIEGCSVTGNTATNGGGIALMSSTGCVIRDTRVDWNEAVNTGGGLHAIYSSFEMHGCEVEDNSTQWEAGAVWLGDTDAAFTGSKFLRNSATESTGGILVDASVLSVSSSEISANGVGLAIAGLAPSTAVAQHNWWGHDSGPYHPTSNPSGLGDGVGDGVLFAPWNVVTGIGGESVVPVSWSALKATYR